MTSTAAIPPPIQPQQPQIIHENEIKQKNIVEEGRNRRALEDIGNLVKLPNLAPTLKKEIGAAKGKKIREKSARNNPKTLTSILLARSDAASGQKNLIVNIDESETSELAAIDYVDDLYNYYIATEVENRIRDYMASQPEINEKMRSILVNWLMEVHRRFKLTPETLYLTLNLIDRFLSIKIVPRKELQLVGISSMLIASKYEEIRPPKAYELAYLTDNAYVREQVLLMEKTILAKLGWYITVPTPYVFLVRYIKASIPSDKEMESMVFFLAELSLVHYNIATLYRPSIIAASAVYAARCTLKRTPFWTKTLKHYTGYSKEQLRDCAKLMVSFHSTAPESQLREVYKKFCSLDRCAVALVTPAKNLLTQS